MFGLPGIYLPSNNALGRRTGRYSTTTSGGYSPVLDIIQDSTFSIDPRAEEGMFIDAVESYGIRNK